MRTTLRYKFYLIFILMSVVFLSACVSSTKLEQTHLGLRLSPESLHETLSLQQHLKIERQGRVNEIDAVLEIDPSHLELVGLAFGQRVLSLSFDGKEIKTWRHIMLPSQVKAEDVLDDLQLVLWPLEAINSGLPEGWRVEDQNLQRHLFFQEKLVTTITYSAFPRWSGKVVLNNLRYQYQLSIDSIF